ncbi:MAG: histidine phosphatase family protein [Verrucomicrobia bacterium]|nr:histidine phosphatase family protein [Verrucomicrobiota bacterium]
MFLGLVLSAAAQPARLIVIRHAEKPEDARDARLSEEGRQRAQRLVKWLAQGKALGTNGPPAALFAARPTPKGRSLRCVETLEPTARHLGIAIRAPYEAEDYQRLAWLVLRDGSLQGKNVVICWTHSELPELAEALGVKPKPSKWKDGDFESAYLITFPGGKATLEKAKQKLKKT